MSTPILILLVIGIAASFEKPKPHVITHAASCPNMNDQIQIEIARTDGTKLIRVNGKLTEIDAFRQASFNAKIDKSGGMHSCWIWSASKNRDGYGSFEVRQKYIGAHRLAYQLEFGPIECGQCVLHNCPTGDNPSCVNPFHLWIGTQADNVRDMERKKRSKHPSGNEQGLRKHPERVARGERQPTAKLNDEKVREIRRDFKILGRHSLANKFGVTPECIYSVAYRRSWKHVA